MNYDERLHRWINAPSTAQACEVARGRDRTPSVGVGRVAAVSARLGRFCGAVLLIAYALAVREERDARRSLHRAAMLRRLSGGVR